MNIIERIDRPCEYVEVAQTALIACQYLGTFIKYYKISQLIHTQIIAN